MTSKADPSIVKPFSGLQALFTSNNLNDLITKRNWKSIELKCQQQPQTAKTWSLIPGFYDEEYDAWTLPIHLICARHPPTTSVVESIIFAFPEGLQMRESAYHRLPLHIACINNASFDVIHLLLTYYRDGVRESDDFGRLPLHYALSNGCGVEVIRALVNAYPAATMTADVNQWLPVHVACYRGTSAEVMRLLLMDYPETASCVTKKKNSPVNILRTKHYDDDPEVIRIMRLLDSASSEAKKNLTVNRNTTTAMSA
mmetsp:Transcript_16088/g.20023  ORF Transcript_16088/g.20023 Transcript_16088/m.20023 type:complete len:256 (+) Transcript_16088:81-848(+)